MSTETSTIFWRAGDKEYIERDVLLAECKRVSELGGSFAIRVYYSDNWYQEFKITYPTRQQEAAQMAAREGEE